MKGLKERVAYLEGLAEGMDLGKSKEGKLISEFLGVLEDMVDYIDAVAESQEDLESYVESMDSDLSDLEDDFYGEEEDEDDFVEVTCPNCGEEVCFDSDILYDEDLIEVTCPACGAVVFVNGDEDADDLDDEEDEDEE